MKVQVFAIYDSKTQVFSQPNLVISIGAALRAFTELANDKTTQIGKYPQDFGFFHLAEYDDETGTFTNLKQPQSLGLAQEYVDSGKFENRNGQITPQALKQ